MSDLPLIDHFMNASVITTYSIFFFISANNSKRCYHSYDKKCHTDYDVSYEVRYEKGPSINDVASIGAQGTPEILHERVGQKNL